MQCQWGHENRKGDGVWLCLQGLKDLNNWSSGDYSKRK